MCTNKAWGKIINTAGPDQTLNVGEKLGGLLGPGDVITLTGPLGAGKTVLAKGIAKGLCVKDEVTSPSFNIILVYEGRLPFHHVDYYRLSRGSEAVDVGVEEYIYGAGVTVIEWAERFPELSPIERLDVEIVFGAGENDRELNFIPFGRKMEKIVEQLIKP